MTHVLGKKYDSYVKEKVRLHMLGKKYDSYVREKV